MTEFTQNYGFELPDFDSSSWHEPLNRTITQIDTLLKVGTGLPIVKGAWQNSIVYTANDRVLDPVDATLWICAVGHTSAASGTFAADRAANPSYWIAAGTGWTARGEWVNNTEYVLGDVAYDSSDYLYAVCNVGHTSPASGTLRDDIANWDVIFDGLSVVTTSVAARDAAIDAKNAAELAETNAETAEANAEAAEDIAVTAASTATTQAGIATTQAGIATTKAGEAETARAASVTAKNAAELAEVNAETAEANAEAAEARVEAIVAALETMAGFRNKIINGDFEITQRGLTQTTNGYGSDDRWKNENLGSTKVHSISTIALSANAPFKNYSLTTVTSVAGAGNLVAKSQRIEGVRTLVGKRATLTFYAAAAESGKFLSIELRQWFGTGGTPSTPVGGIGAQKLPLGTLLTIGKFSVTIDIPPIDTKTLGTNNDDCLDVIFWFDAGSNYNTRSSNLGHQSGNFFLAHVSLVEGDATAEDDPFSPRHIQQELALCQRYFEKSYTQGTEPGVATNSGVHVSGILNGFLLHSPSVRFAVAKRSSPTVITYAPANGAGGNMTEYNLGSSIVQNRPAGFASTPATSGFELQISGGSGTPGNFVRFQWTADAEL